MRIAEALWYTASGIAEIRPERLGSAPAGWVTIETHYSAISRGTERLVWQGAIGPSEWQRMRAPFQAGDFPFPVKYGYSAAGRVIDGPEALIGQNTFALFPHQTVFQLPADKVTLLPTALPLARATLAANMETALNAVWDSGVTAADEIIVIGGGIVGLLTGYLCARLPGARMTLVDVNHNVGAIADNLGVAFVQASPDDPDALAQSITSNADVVFHTSATGPGLATAINACGFEATLVEMSWYGDKQIEAGLGGAFHAKRLRLISSQVGHVASRRRARWSHARRLESAVRLLEDPALDCLVCDRIDFAALPERLAGIFEATNPALPPVITYPAAHNS